MIIVTGPLFVDPAEREQYLAGCLELMRMARDTEGCFDFHLSADPIEPGRINVVERWDSVEAVEAFRGAGSTDEQNTQILDAKVVQYEIASETAL